MRTTTYQSAIVKYLQQYHLVSLTDLTTALQADFSTLYRNMQSLEHTGVVRRVVIDSKRTLYELTTHQHDHFVCTECAVVEAITQTNVSLPGHEVDDVIVRGRCGDCRGK